MKISPAVKLAWQLAAQEAVAARKEQIGPVQMFCGITKVPEVLTAVMTQAELKSARAELETALTPFVESGIELTALRRALRARVGVGDHERAPTAIVSRSAPLKTLFDRALALSAPDEGETVVARLLLAAMLEDRNLLVTRAVSEQRGDIDALLRKLRDPRAERPAEQSMSPAGRTPYLDRYGRDLTALARAGALGPVVGRREEVLQVMRTLMRRTKSNPVLVGEAGVGKTAVAELLSIRLAMPDVAGPLANRRVVEISLSSLLAGASHAGEREQRLECIVCECRENPDIILFIDELHTLVKAGGVGGAIDPADIFKPALARGEIKCVGATTHDEYARYIESDPALERRFDRIVVAEPDSDAAFEILQGLRTTLEVHHGVRLPDDTLRAAIDLSVRFDTAHHLPDKALDLLDLAAARTRLPQLSAMGDPDAHAATPATVTRETIAAVLARKLGIPPELLGVGPAELPLEEIESGLASQIVGQDEVIARIARRLKLAQAQLSVRRGPLGVFLFMGPTGVGKTALAQALAQHLFNDARSMTRIDLSEYMEEHSVAKLIGAPPGYVGHDERGALTGALRARPYSVVLLDEIDKAHPRVCDIFLQLFDEGRLTDSKGRTADGRHAIFVMTANPPPERAQPIGFAHADATPQRESLKERFRPEFLNRINDVLFFQPLSHEHVRTLVARKLEEIACSVRQRHGVQLIVHATAVSGIARAAFNPQYGVRHLQRTIEERVEMPLADLLRAGAQTGDLALECDGEAVVFRSVTS